MSADTLDVLTAAEAQAAVNDTGTITAELERMNTGVARRLDQACGAIVNRTITDEFHDGGKRAIRLKWRPIVSITTLTEYDTGGTATSLTEEDFDTKTSNGFMFDDRVGRVYRRTSGWDDRFTAGRKNIKITYVAGRAATTALVDAMFKEAAAIILAHFWRREQGGGTVTFGGSDDVEVPGVPGFFVPRAALELLTDELLGGPPLHLGGSL